MRLSVEQRRADAKRHKGKQQKKGQKMKIRFLRKNQRRRFVRAKWQPMEIGAASNCPRPPGPATHQPLLASHPRGKQVDVQWTCPSQSLARADSDRSIDTIVVPKTLLRSASDSLYLFLFRFHVTFLPSDVSV